MPMPDHICAFGECEAPATRSRGPMRYCDEHAAEYDAALAVGIKPITVDEAGTIIDGHARVAALLAHARSRR
jgi:hypothetical protein